MTAHGEAVMRWLAAMAAAVVLAGCAPTTPLTPVNRLGELKPGISTKVDVERVLGARDGVGGAAFPPGTRPAAASYEIWYYVNYQKKSVDREVYTVLPRVLLVFFEKDVFSGVMWFDLLGAEATRER
jgi:hypothetical protein